MENLDPFSQRSRALHPVMIVVRFLFSCIKFPFFIAFLTASFFYFCLSLLIPFRSAKRLFLHLISKVTCRVFLILTGNIIITVQHSPLEETVLEAGRPRSIVGGDVIVANFGSYLNLIWLQYSYAPLFAVTVSATEVVSHSFHSLLLSILASVSPSVGAKFPFCKILHSASELGVPVVVFPEGRPTNVQAVIPFVPLDLSGSVVHVLGFSHSGNGISADFVSGNGLWHLFCMNGRSLSEMKVRIATASDVAAAAPNYRTLLARLLRVPLYPASQAQKYHSD
jgi:hypothetical protein